MSQNLNGCNKLRTQPCGSNKIIKTETIEVVTVKRIAFPLALLLRSRATEEQCRSMAKPGKECRSWWRSCAFASPRRQPAPPVVVMWMPSLYGCTFPFGLAVSSGLLCAFSAAVATARSPRVSCSRLSSIRLPVDFSIKDSSFQGILVMLLYESLSGPWESQRGMRFAAFAV